MGDIDIGVQLIAIVMCMGTEQSHVWYIACVNNMQLLAHKWPKAMMLSGFTRRKGSNNYDEIGIPILMIFYADPFCNLNIFFTNIFQQFYRKLNFSLSSAALITLNFCCCYRSEFAVFDRPLENAFFWKTFSCLIKFLKKY